MMSSPHRAKGLDILDGMQVPVGTRSGEMEGKARPIPFKLFYILRLSFAQLLKMALMFQYDHWSSMPKKSQGKLIIREGRRQNDRCYATEASNSFSERYLLSTSIGRQAEFCAMHQQPDARRHEELQTLWISVKCATSVVIAKTKG